MNADLWLGAVTTLAGALLGGAISFVLSHQQMKDARMQRAEESLLEKARRSEDRRFSAYSDLLTRSRAYRNAIRPELANLMRGSDGGRIDALAGSADAASSLVFLLLESVPVFDACRAIATAIGRSQELLHSASKQFDETQWRQVNDEMASSLRQFEAAVRDEFEVGGVDTSWILSRSRPHGSESGRA